VGTLQQVYRLTNHRASSSGRLAHSRITSLQFLDTTRSPRSRNAIGGTFPKNRATRIVYRWQVMLRLAGVSDKRLRQLYLGFQVTISYVTVVAMFGINVGEPAVQAR
jgi:hypothetical protein